VSAEANAVLEVRGLCKAYPGFLLADVSFSLPRGYIMGLIGPNGAGKTTTLKLILGLLRRDGGTINAFGIDPARQGAKVRSRIGFVHDEPRFYRSLSLEQNAALVARFYPTWDSDAFSRHADAFGLPLSHNAELVVLDEPTSGLDPVFRRDLLDTLTELLQDERASILFSTHITSDLERIADYITLIQNGRIVFCESKDEILDRWGLVKGGLDQLDALPPEFFRGVHRGAHGFEALTDDVSAVRRQLGDTVVIDKATLDDVVLYTTGGESDA
jgi:ABC-2 type transport system ATP-binding protein